MKKLLKGFMAFAMMLSLVACGGKTEEKTLLEVIKEQGYITLSTSPDFAPSEFYILGEDGQNKIVGTDIFLAEAIAEKIGVELKISATTFTEVINEVQFGNADLGISGFAWNETRAKSVKFSDDYAQMASDGWQGLMMRKEDAAKYKTLEDVKAANLRIGAQTGSIQYEMASHLTPAESIIPMTDNNVCANELSIGAIDAYVITSTQAQAAMTSFDNITILPETEFNLDPENKYGVTGAVFAMNPKYDNESLIELVNEVIAEAKVVDPETGKCQLDIWTDEAEALLPFDLTEQIDWDTIYDK